MKLMLNGYSNTSSRCCQSRLQNYKSSFSLQLMKNNFESIAINSLERIGLIIKPVMMNARSLAAELAGAVNNV